MRENLFSILKKEEVRISCLHEIKIKIKNHYYEKKKRKQSLGLGSAIVPLPALLCQMKRLEETILSMGF